MHISKTFQNWWNFAGEQVLHRFCSNSKKQYIFNSIWSRGYFLTFADSLPNLYIMFIWKRTMLINIHDEYYMLIMRTPLFSDIR